MKKISKNKKAINEKLDKSKIYDISEAISLAKELSFEKFNTSFRASFNLNVDPKHADQQLRGKIALPNGTGKTQKILTIVDGQNVDIAKQAGADFVGGEELITKIDREKWFDFDVVLTTPNMMPKFGKLGKVLGPKGLMPNPKLGTLTTNIKKAIEDIKKGSVEYRTDKDGNINILIGKKSFSDQELVENYNAIYDELKKIRPAKVKGKYFLNIAISTSMGPGLKIKI